MLLELVDHAVEIGIPGAEAPGEPVPAALGDPLAVGDDLELTGPARRLHGFDAEALLDEGRETRDLGLVVLSRRAVDDLDSHATLHSASAHAPADSGEIDEVYLASFELRSSVIMKPFVPLYSNLLFPRR